MAAKLTGYFIALLLAVGIAQSQVVVEDFAWSELGLVRDPPAQTHLFDFDDIDITFETNYLFQFVVDMNSDTSFGALETAGRDGIGWGIGAEHESVADYDAEDDVVIAEASWAVINPTAAGLPEQFTDIADTYWGQTYYFRWFNAPTMEEATEAGFIRNTSWVFPSTGESTEWIDGSMYTYLTYPDGSPDLADNSGSEYDGVNGTGWQALPLADGYRLTVASAYGTPSPGLGTNWIASDALVNASVADAPVVNGTTQHVVVGWIGTGSVTNSAPPTHPAHPDVHYANQLDAFDFTIETNSTLAWLWATNYWLDLDTAGDGSGNLDVATGWARSEGGFTLTATADDFMQFTGWTGDTNGCTIAANQLTVVSMDGPRSITAEFEYGYTEMDTPVRWYVEQGMAPGLAEDWDDLDVADSDTDGFLNWEEFVTGTNPQDGASHFRILSMSWDPDDGTTLQWFGGALQPYAPNTDWIVHGESDILNTNSWDVIINVPRGAGMTNTWTSGIPGASSNMNYRIRATRW